MLISQFFVVLIEVSSKEFWLSRQISGKHWQTSSAHVFAIVSRFSRKPQALADQNTRELPGSSDRAVRTRP